jgi:type I restriction enzyme M protein
VIDEYFSAEKQVILTAEEKLSDLDSSLSDLLEEQGGEEGFLYEENFEGGKLTDASLKKRIKVLDAKDDAEELDVLKRCLRFREDIANTKRVIKVAQYDLLVKLTKRYASLTEDEIKRLVIEKKWFAALSSHLDSEMQRISQVLTTQVSELAKRYAQTLPEIDKEVDDLEQKVNAHLALMGYEIVTPVATQFNL